MTINNLFRYKKKVKKSGILGEYEILKRKVICHEGMQHISRVYF